MKYITEFVNEDPKLKGYKVMSWDEEKVKNFWDYESIFETRYFTYTLGKPLCNYVSKYLQGNVDVLDYGAGKGFLTKELLRRGIKTASFDLSPESRNAIAERNKDNPNYLGGYSPEDIATKENCFDVIFMVEVVEHLEDDVREKVFTQVHSLLKKGGVFIMTAPNNEDLRRQLVCNPVTNELFHAVQHVYSWTGESLSKAAKPFGFTAEFVGETNLRYHTSPMKKLIKSIFRSSKSVDKDNLVVVLRKD